MPVPPVRPPEYRRREPEKEPLYQVLAGHLETFLQHTRTSEHQLPLHVEKEMRAYLECGILAYGFVRARCADCGKSRAVAFSCKKRGVLPLVLRPAHGRYGGAPGRRRAAPGAGAPVGAQLSLRDALPPRLRRRVGLGRTGGVSARGGRLVSTSGAGHGP